MSVLVLYTALQPQPQTPVPTPIQDTRLTLNTVCISVIKENFTGCKINNTFETLVEEWVVDYNESATYVTKYRVNEFCGYTILYDSCANRTYGQVMYTLNRSEVKR